MKDLIILIVVIIASIILYVIIRCIFLKNGIFPFGIGLEKKDWLSFLSGYLAFIGTIIITSVVIIQNRHYREMDVERLRLQNMPNLKINKLDLFSKIDYSTFKELKEKTFNPNYKEFLNKSNIADSELVSVIDNCPLIIWDSGKFLIKGEENSQSIIPRKDADLKAIYSATNYGIGSAINVEISVKDKLKSKGEIYDFGGLHLKEGEKVYFEIVLPTLANEKDLIVDFSFCDIFGNKYTQKCLFKLKILGTKFNFDIIQKDKEPIYVK
jgi:hypothetical protein